MDASYARVKVPILARRHHSDMHVLGLLAILGRLTSLGIRAQAFGRVRMIFAQRLRPHPRPSHHSNQSASLTSRRLAM